jgi:hypothetical protein
MKALFTAIAACLLLASNGLAQSGSDAIIKKRAKELNNQNNVRQGIAPPTQSQPATAQPATPPPPAQNSAALSRLQADLAAIAPGSTANPAQKLKIVNDLMAVALTSKPATNAAAKLAEDLWTGIATKPLSSTSRGRLVTEMDAVLNPSKYPQAKMPAIFDDIQAIFQENGADRKHAVVISDDVKALQAH